MVIAIYVDWMVWWIQCCRPFLWPLIAFVPSIPQKRIKVLSRPFDASNLITTSFKSVAFLDAVSRTIPRKHSMGVWVCASNFIFLWQFFFFKLLVFFTDSICLLLFSEKKTNKCVDHGFVGRFFITGLLYQGTPHRFYKTSLLSLSYSRPREIAFPF